MFNALRSVAVAASLTALAGAAVAGPVAVDFEGLKSAVASADPNGAVIGTLQAGGYSMAFENFLAFDDTLDSVTLPYKRETIATRSVFARNVIDSRPEDGTDNLIATIRLSGSGRTFSTLSFNYGLGQVGLNVYVTGSKGSSGAMNVVTNDCFKWNTDDNSANANCPGDDKPAASFDLSAYGEIESIAFGMAEGGRYFTLDDLQLVPTSTNPGGGGTVPEPASLALTLAALLGAGAVTRRRRAD